MPGLFLGDEHPVVLAGLRSFFSGTEFRIVGDATDGLQLLQGIEQTCPHLVLADLSQKTFRNVAERLRTGIINRSYWKYRFVELTPELRASPKQIVVDAVRKAVPKRTSVRGLYLATKKAFRFTPRETEVVRLIAQGHTNKEIAEELGIAVDTVKEYIQNIFHKTSLSNRNQVALWAVKKEIVVL